MMKKDIEWLKKEVWKQDIVMDKGYIYTDDLMSIINEVDEPEVLSQEWISDNAVVGQYPVGIGHVVPAYKLQSLLVPKQELPVIPKFVDEYLCRAKADITLMRVMELANTRNELPKWKKEYDWISANDETFARAWLDGYEVEEEQKYYVIDKEDNILLIRGYGGIEKADNLKITNSGGGALKLTEQEIKGYDKRYWPFAEPVEQADFRLPF